MGLVTLFADASVLPQLGTAGWGAWAKGDGRASQLMSGPLETHKGPGMRPAFDQNANVAELMAIEEALLHLEQTSYFHAADEAIMIQSDCVAALEALMGSVPNTIFKPHPQGVQSINYRHPSRGMLSPVELQSARIINTTLARIKLRAILRHVKGHSNNGTRSWVNRQCDKLAYDAAHAAAGSSRRAPANGRR